MKDAKGMDDAGANLTRKERRAVIRRAGEVLRGVSDALDRALDTGARVAGARHLDFSARALEDELGKDDSRNR